MKRSEILASPTVKEAGAGLLKWKLGVKAVMLSENTKLGRSKKGNRPWNQVRWEPQ